jgi:hypothetical protein
MNPLNNPNDYTQAWTAHGLVLLHYVTLVNGIWNHGAHENEIGSIPLWRALA